MKKDDHKCYMQYKRQKGGRAVYYTKKDKRKCTYTEKYIFFVYECRQETGEHIPNLIIAQDFEGKTYEFENNDEFCKWLFSKEHKGYTSIAHSAKGYDSQFILKCLHR